MTGGGSGREGGRALKTRVKTARKRSLASTLWLERQLNDPYVAQAKREGYRSRAAYKLLEIDEKYKLLKAGQRIVDLGAAPGGWAQVAAAKTGSQHGRGRVIAIDLQPMDAVEGVEFRQMDFHDADAPERLRDWLGGLADGVMSDMAANATGHRKTDQLRIIGLVELAADFASEVLAPGGFFLAKVLQGAPRACCSPGSSGSSRPSGISSPRPAAPAAPKCTFWRQASAARSRRPRRNTKRRSGAFVQPRLNEARLSCVKQPLGVGGPSFPRASAVAIVHFFSVTLSRNLAHVRDAAVGALWVLEALRCVAGVSTSFFFATNSIQAG